MTAHAYDLIAARQDEPLHPGADAFLQDHIKTCAECRRYERTIAHVDRLLRMREPALALPRLATTGAAHGSQRALAAALVPVVFVAGLTAGAALREFRSPDRLQGASVVRVDPSDLNACEIIARAAPLAGHPSGGTIADHGYGVHEHTCAYNEDAGNRWRDPHLVLVTRAVSSDEAPLVLENFRIAPKKAEWREIANGKWVTVARWEENYSYTAVAVFDEPYFFVVTGPDEENADRLAEAVRHVLNWR